MHGCPLQRLNSVSNGLRGVTADAALTGVEASFWIGLQTDCDLWHELRDGERPKLKRLARELAHA